MNIYKSTKAVTLLKHNNTQAWPTANTAMIVPTIITAEN